MDEPFKLVRNKLSHDSIESAKKLVADTESGECIGFAVTAMYKKGSYTINTTGEAHNSPTFAIGMVVMLLYQLIKNVISRQGKQTL